METAHEVIRLFARHAGEVTCAALEALDDHDDHEGHDHGDHDDHGHGSTTDMMGLRIASIFVILLGSSAGALFPIIARRIKWLHIPKSVFDFAKYFGSGIIIATSFIHLLAPAVGHLGSKCLSESWSRYPYALGLCMISIFALFVVELIAFRWGTAKLAKLGKAHDPHGHHIGAHSAHGPEPITNDIKGSDSKESSDVDVESAKSGHDHDNDKTALHQIIGIAILEFGVVLHSVLIGLTLAISDEFKILFVVLVFHQTFEGLGIGSRLAYMNLGPKYRWVPYAGALLYGITTPVGIAAGLGARSTYVHNSNTSIIINGIFYSVSAGIMLYTGLVELLAHDFLFSKDMQNASNIRLSLALFAMFLGAGLMSMLGAWA